MLYCFKMTAFLCRVISTLAKIKKKNTNKKQTNKQKNKKNKKKKKNTFPKEFFNEIWLKVREHEYIYTTEIKCLKNITFQNGCQNNFLILCNIANLY